MATTRRILPLVSLNPYQGAWIVKVRVTNKGNLRPYKNARGEGYVFNVELPDEDGTQIQATMFNEAAQKFHPIFELGTVYYISKGTIKVANKNFSTVPNTYEMIINRYSIVEKATDEDSFIPEITYNFVKIGQLDSYINGKEVVDVIGVVQKVSSTLSVRRKSDNEILTKRDITIVDDSNKSVVASFWNDLATKVGCKLLDMVDTAPIVAIQYVKVGDFQGLSLSTLNKSNVSINPDITDAKNLRTWYNFHGKDLKMALTISDRIALSHITNNSTLTLDKPIFFNLNVYITYIKSQSLWYRACKTCNKKVVEAAKLDYWCEACQKNENTYSLRYIMTMTVSDSSGEAWCTAFNEQVEQIIGCTADELNKIKNEEGEERYQLKLKELLWIPRLFRVSVAQTEYMNEKRQKITVTTYSPIDYSAESTLLLEEISKMKN